MVNIPDLMSLIKRNVSRETIIEILPSIKCSIEEEGDDEVVLEVTADRPDLFSAEGIARAIRNYLGIGRDPYRTYVPLGTSNINVIVNESVKDVRPFIACAIVRDVKLTEEAIRQIVQLQEKLHMSYGLRRRMASIGIYDLDKVKPPIYYEARPPSEIKFKPLDEDEAMDGYSIVRETSKGREYGWIIEGCKRYPLLRDSTNGVLSMPPIVNSEDTKVTVNTKNLFVDITGLNDRIINQLLTVIAAALVDRGGKLYKVKVSYDGRDVATPLDITKVVRIDYKKVANVLGVRLETEKISELLIRMGYDLLSLSQDALVCRTPPYRVDIINDVDVIEDVAISYGYNNFELEYPPVLTIGKLHEKTKFAKKVRELMVGLGFQEIYTYVLSSSSSLIIKPAHRSDVVKVGNPVSSEYEVLRNNLSSKLLLFLTLNKHLEHPQRIFEYGDVIVVEKGRPINQTRLAAAISNYEVSFEDAQSALYSLLRSLKLEPTLEPCDSELYLKGRCAYIIVSNKNVGTLGEVSPEVLERLKLEYPVVMFELNADDVYELYNMEVTFNS